VSSMQKAGTGTCDGTCLKLYFSINQRGTAEWGGCFQPSSILPRVVDQEGSGPLPTRPLLKMADIICYYTTTTTTVLRLSGFCLGLPGWAVTRKAKPGR